MHTDSRAMLIAARSSQDFACWHHSPGLGLTLHSVAEAKYDVSRVEPAAVIERSGERRTIMTYINWTKDVFIDPVTFSASAGPGGIPNSYLR